MKRILYLSALIAATSSPIASAYTQEPHMYMGLLYSYVAIDSDVKVTSGSTTINESFDLDNSLLGLSVGYQVNKYFAIEGRGYGGVSDDDILGEKVKIKNHFNVLAKGIIPIHEEYFRVYGLLGYGYTKLDVASSSESDSNIMYGVGFSVSNDKPISLDIEWIRAYDDDSNGTIGSVKYHEDLQGDMFNLNLVYHFK